MMKIIIEILCVLLIIGGGVYIYKDILKKSILRGISTELKECCKSLKIDQTLIRSNLSNICEDLNTKHLNSYIQLARFHTLYVNQGVSYLYSFVKWYIIYTSSYKYLISLRVGIINQSYDECEIHRLSYENFSNWLYQSKKKSLTEISAKKSYLKTLYNVHRSERTITKRTIMNIIANYDESVLGVDIDAEVKRCTNDPDIMHNILNEIESIKKNYKSHLFKY